MIVTEFIPEQLLSYVKLNYMYSSQHRVYSADVPEFLWDRPRSFVQHCLKNLEAACYCTSQQVQEQSKGLYKVQREQSCEWYSVDLGDKDRFPSCDTGDQSGSSKENLLTDYATIDLPEAKTLLAELIKHDIAEVESGVRLSVCGQVLESRDFKSLKHPHWLNDKALQLSRIEALKPICHHLGAVYDALLSIAEDVVVSEPDVKREAL
ncbi:hypothetical protein DPX16_23728 [Anabarilius grahami]|uniref:Uncharacterized protein n=1 Tax=Anabarilius grahami TaxID=495550 RepID=A0A3N0XMZ9_ANAGA|nr:hypothetical protein DPX16_23728 [Anabarilius grahami]